MGTGTTGLVSKELNRNYIGFELQKEYIDLWKKNKRIRWKKVYCKRTCFYEANQLLSIGIKEWNGKRIRYMKLSQ
jgi:DNA modification methylase